MDIYAKLLQYKNFFAAIIAVISLALFLSVMPPVTNILLYFWPLFLSTALVLLAIIVINQTLPIFMDYSGDREVEALLDYVAGHPELLD
ncbi:hypothetical protein CDL12_28454 [Handroanthus impetiginosus]|uniref:Uncharacterized protein n=1 Tax=Handroanthus impetiginosus TaxID=429701 RepID=A0A2G9G164_9LAMI|nr:hypothetical protein CDL12_28454 [Handroanthus impetiginosus]